MRAGGLWAFLAAAWADDDPEIHPWTPSPHVRQLTSANFRELVEGRPAYSPLIFFHVQWCKHCRATMPQFHKSATGAAEHFAAQSKDIQKKQGVKPPAYFTMDCTEHSKEYGVHQPCKKYADVKFPSIVILRGEKMFTFDRPRIADTISWWAVRMTRPPVAFLPDLKTLQSGRVVAPKEELTFILCEPKCGSAFTDQWPSVAEGFMDKSAFGLLGNTEDCAKLARNTGMTGSPLLVAEPGTHEISPVPYVGSLSEKRVVRWLQLHRYPAIIELNNYSMPEVLDTEFPIIVLTFDKDSEAKVSEKLTALVRERRACMSEEKCARSPLGGMFIGKMNASEEGNVDLLATHFSLASDSAPRAFVTRTKAKEHRMYWENADKLSLGSVSLKTASALMADDSSLDYNGPSFGTSMWSWQNRSKKKVIRFAWQGPLQAGLVALVLSGIVFALVAVFRACCAAEPEDSKED